MRRRMGKDKENRHPGAEGGTPPPPRPRPKPPIFQPSTKPPTFKPPTKPKKKP